MLRKHVVGLVVAGFSAVGLQVVAVAGPAVAAEAWCGTAGVFDESARTCTYADPGVDTFTVPRYVGHVRFTAYGATMPAAEVIVQPNPGVMGGTFATQPGEEFAIYVGGAPTGTKARTGGFNGGGDAGVAANDAKGGAGASDVRRRGTALTDRIVVAGGTGGSAGTTEQPGSVYGGDGGQLEGRPGKSTGDSASGQGGNQQGGGRSSGNGGSAGFGFGGKGGKGDVPVFKGGAGGGGGYYGGGSSGAVLSIDDTAAGGGGSGYLSPKADNVRIGTVARAEIPADGDGKVVVSWGDPPPTSVTLNVFPSSPVAYGATVTIVAKVGLPIKSYPAGVMTIKDNGVQIAQGTVTPEPGTFDSYLTVSRTSDQFPGPDHRLVATFTDPDGILTTSKASATFTRGEGKPVITADPAPTSITYGQVATFTAAGRSEFGGAATVQWQVKKIGESSFQDIASSGTGTTLSVTPTNTTESAQDAVTRFNGRQYRARFTGTSGRTATSASATLTVAKRNVTITAPSLSKAFGKNAPQLLPEISGLLADDNGGIRKGYQCASLGSPADAEPGTYAVKCPPLDGTDNYAMTNVDGVMKVGVLRKLSLIKDPDPGGSNGKGAIVSDPAGIDCGNACLSETGTFIEGETVKLIATPKAGSQFVSVIGVTCDEPVPSTARQCTFAMPTGSDTEVHVRFGGG